MRTAKDTKHRIKRSRKRCHIRYKRRVLIAVIVLLAVVLSGAGIIYFINRRQSVVTQYVERRPASHEKDGVIYYQENYPEIYSEELRIIFGEDCKIGEKETIYVEGEECECGYCAAGYQYDTWTVTYHDRDGVTFTQTIDNSNSLESLQLSWLKNHMGRYYEKKYLLDYFEEGTFMGLTETGTAKLTHCTVTVGIGGYSYTMNQKEEFDRIAAGGQKYQEQLLTAYQNKDTMLRLSELNYEEVYLQFPMKATFFLSIDDKGLSGEEKAVHEKAVQSRVSEMMQEILKDTEYTCNLQVNVNSANGYEDMYDGARDWRYYILQGKQIEPDGEPTIGYSWAHAYAYEGIFW